MVTDPAEPMAHQLAADHPPGQCSSLFGLNELAVHHYDVTAPFGPAYRPPDPVPGLLAGMFGRIGTLPGGAGSWDRVLRLAGRNQPG